MIKRKKRQKKRADKKRVGVEKNSLPGDEAIIRRASEIAGPLCAAEGMELVCVECASGPGGAMVRFYIDKPGGVTIDDCACISRRMSDIMDVTMDGVMELLGLEVSSPGPNRPLGKESDFERFKGNAVRVKFRFPNGEKFKKKRHETVQGILIGMSGENVEINLNDKSIAIPFNDIIRARLV